MKIKQMMNKFLRQIGVYKHGKELYYCTYLWTEREYDEDRWYDEYYLSGWQIFPVIRKVHGILMSGSKDELTKFYRKQKERLNLDTKLIF